MTTRDDAARRDAMESTMRGTAWFTPAQLAARWNVCSNTVRAIPRDALPYREFGQSNRRRYKPENVIAYENANGRSEAAA